MKKETFYSLLLLLVSTSVAVLVSEMAAKKVVESEFVYWSAFIPDNSIGWRFKPSSQVDVEWYQGTEQRIVSNSLGYRDSENPAGIESGSTVVSIQGDSNLIGYGIQSPDLVSNVLENLLNKNTQTPKHHVINAGTSGYDLQSYVLQFPEIQRSFRPKYNFVFFNMENDHLYTFLSTPYNLPRPFYDLKDGELELHRPEYRIRSQLYPLKLIPSMRSEDQHVRNYYFGVWKHGYVDGLAAQSYLAYLVASRLGYANKFSQFIGFHPKPEKVSKKELAKGFTFSVLSRYQKQWHPIFDKGQHLITGLFKTYGSFPGTKTVVVLLPDKLDLVQREELADMFKKYTESDFPDHEPFYGKMKQSIEEAGLEYIDLRPIFLKEENVESLYLPGNSHIGPKGHKLIAGALTNYLRHNQQEPLAQPSKLRTTD